MANENQPVITDQAVPVGSATPGVTDTSESAEQNELNPLGEQEIKVRTKAGVDFFHQGIRRREGDEFLMAESQARNALHLVDEVAEDGSLRQIKHAGQTGVAVPRTNLAGMARHERVGALEEEEKQLSGRLEAVRSQLQAERGALEQDQARRAAQGAQGGPQGGSQAPPASGAAPAASGAAGGASTATPSMVTTANPVPTAQPGSPSPAFTPGTSGAPGTTAVPARPGEPGAGTQGTSGAAGTAPSDPPAPATPTGKR